jgi:ElaB/YqjD/DUF883 family membrane-anchored ribosome-binding protein
LGGKFVWSGLMSNVINFIKDKLIWAADWVEDHPWWSLAIMAAAVVVAIL